MFSAGAIAIAFVGMIVTFLSIGAIKEAKSPKLFKAAMWAAMVPSIYCLLAGFNLAIDWVNPLAEASVEEVVAVKPHGRWGWVVILAIAAWPYVLIGLGGYFTYTLVQGLWDRRKSR